MLRRLSWTIAASVFVLGALGALSAGAIALTVARLDIGERLRAATATASQSPIGITTDRAGRALFPFVLLRPGDQVQAELTVQNVGTLPFQYRLSVEGAAGPLTRDATAGLQLEVSRVANGDVLYRGPLAVADQPLGNLAPGGSERLRLRVSLPHETGNAFQGLTERVDFVFRAVFEGRYRYFFPLIAE